MRANACTMSGVAVKLALAAFYAREGMVCDEQTATAYDALCAVTGMPDLVTDARSIESAAFEAGVSKTA